MLVYQPSKYLDFLSYCRQRRLFSRNYQNLRLMKQSGEIAQNEYVKALRKLHNRVIELELQYFDILHMRL